MIKGLTVFCETVKPFLAILVNLKGILLSIALYYIFLTLPELLLFELTEIGFP